MKKGKAFLIIIFTLIISASLIGGVFLVRQTQEVRRQAAEEQEVVDTSIETDLEELTSDDLVSTQSAELDCDLTCTDLYAIDSDGDQILDSELQNLEPGEICFEVEGWTNCDQGITEARFQLIGWDEWQFGEYDRDQPDESDYGRYFYFQWCHPFDEVTETSCRDIDAQVCVGEECR